MYQLIWLDPFVNELGGENIQAQKQLRLLFDDLKTFDNAEEFLKYIRFPANNRKFIFIINGGLGQVIVPKILNYEQIVSIYVYCKNEKIHKKWAKKYPKVNDFSLKNELIFVFILLYRLNV